MAWFIECENGTRSVAYDNLQQARAALPDMQSMQAQMSPRYSKPVRFVSSEGEKVEITAGAPSKT